MYARSSLSNDTKINIEIASFWRETAKILPCMRHVVMVRNIKCGYSFSKLEQAEHFETKAEQIG